MKKSKTERKAVLIYHDKVKIDALDHYCIIRNTTRSELLRKFIDWQVKTKQDFQIDSPVEYISE